MDAMDVTNLPAPQLERENMVVAREEYVDKPADFVSHENVECSFEGLMCAMFDEVMQKEEALTDEVLLKDVETEILLTGDIVADEDVDLLIANVIQDRDVSNNEIKSDRYFLPSEDEGFVAQEEVPTLECELDISSFELKDMKEEKNVKEDSFKEEEKEEIVYVFPEEEHRSLVQLIKEKSETPQKIEIKYEYEQEDDIGEVVDNVLVKNPKKVAKKLNISVEDLRTVNEMQAVETTVTIAEEGQMTSFEGDSSFSDGKSVSTSHTSASSQKAEMTENTSSTQFSSVLAEQIKANSADLVQRGKIVLKDGNMGEIRLQLKPAHLGLVRINLKMTGDKKMQGEVTVSSQEAYSAFEDSMEELVSSFKDAGFDTSSFNLNWKGGREEVAREDLRDKYFSPEKTALSLREKLNVTENIYEFGQAENIDILV